ncbi:MAG TPA: PKD domain-containing protein [Methanosarcina sp.]|nr:PKD domain-containing protein [Methanosarcina sp.]
MAKIRASRWVCVFIIFMSPLLTLAAGAIDYIDVSEEDSIRTVLNNSSSSDSTSIKLEEHNESVQINRENLTTVSASKKSANTVIRERVGYNPLNFEFTDFSENVSSLIWDLDNLEASNYSDLLHTIVDEGVYKVDLNLTNEDSNDSAHITVNVLKAPDPSFPVLPEAKFGSNITSGHSPLTVQFIDFSRNSDSLCWDFGDGKKSCCPGPKHTFCCPGNYTVSLTAENDNGSSSAFIVITVLKPSEQSSIILPEAKFSASNVYGQFPLTVKFVDASENANTWEWDFGDGNKSSEKSPEYTYTASGNYTVSLLVSNENGEDSKKVKNLIQVGSSFNHSTASIDYSDADSTFSTEYAESKRSDGENKSGVMERIIGRGKLSYIKDIASSAVSNSSFTELTHPTGYEINRFEKDAEAVIKSWRSEIQIKNILWVILILELIGISLIGSAIRKRKKHR